MKDFTTISRIYFVGIGGIGMSALAKYYVSKNVTVSGYDKTPTPLTMQMEGEGVHIHYEDSVELLDKETELVVYTPAVPKDHKELNYYWQHNYEVIKRSALLGEITKATYNICIAGTHGKTTISTMIAHILRYTGFGCNAFLGGISVNYNANFWSSGNNVSVVEADEYDRSFLELSPDIALVSAMDADHLDIYGTKENMEKSFIAFTERLRHDGLLLTNYNISSDEFSSSNHIRYSLQNSDADVYADNIQIKNGGYYFDVITKSWQLPNVALHMGGLHNVENAIAAIVIAHHLNIEDEKIRKAVADFKGVKRRFEYIIAAQSNKDDIIFIDDYAHHPQELNALISSAKALFPRRKCTIIFQPHLFSRTKDLAHEFAASLDNADEILLLPIYPARELPVEGVSSNTILTLMKNKNARIINKNELLEFLQNDFLSSIQNDKKSKLLITAGAGDIDQMLQPIKEVLLYNIHK